MARRLAFILWPLCALGASGWGCSPSASGNDPGGGAAGGAGGAAGAAGGAAGSAAGSLAGGAGVGGAGGMGATGGTSGLGGAGGSGDAGAGGQAAGGAGVGGGGGIGGDAGTAGAGAGAGGDVSGASGSGGVAASGGTSGGAGNAGTSGTGGAPADPCDISGKILCEDFESEALGSLPSDAPFAARNCFDTTNTLKVDAGAHHGGSQALLGMNIPYADCQVHADLGASLTEYWVRAWVYYGGAAPTASTHEVTVFELVPAASTDDPSIRVGYRGDTCMPIGVELNITGGGQEETGCTGAVPVADTWYCYVLHVQQASSSVTTDLSIDGVDQSYTNHGNPQTEITSQVANVRYLRLGPRSYSGNFANPIYVDDVAVATAPLTCD